MAIRLGATTIALAGWLVDPGQPALGRAQRLMAIRDLVEGYGLGSVELTLDLALVYPHIFDSGFYADVAELQRTLGFSCTVHLPILWVDPASLTEPMRQASVDCLVRSVELTRPLAVDGYVLHLWGMTTVQIALLIDPPAQRPALFAAAMAQAERSLASLVQVVDPARLFVENLEAPPLEVLWPTIDRHGCSICLDVGHLAWQQASPTEVLSRYGDRVREVHLHDAVAGPGRPRDHLPLGQGEVDYRAVLAALQEGGYEGAVVLENNNRADLESSLAALSDLR